MRPYAHVDPDAPKGGELRLGAVGSFDNFNPFSPRGMSPAQIGLTYETLGEQESGEELVMRGLLAEGFELAEDRSWLLVRLRPEARFQDGTAVTAADVAYTFRALMTEASPIYRDYYEQVEAVEAEGEREVRFRFAEGRNRELPLIVCQLPVLPARWWAGRSLGEPQTEAMPGSGPYRVREFRVGSGVVYERDPGWWGAALPINAGRYNFDVIRVDYYRDEAVAREAFLAGELDFFSERTIKDWVSGYDAPAARDGRISRREAPAGGNRGMSGIFMNTRGPFLADKRVRKALILLFDYEWINRSLFYGAYTRCDSFFTRSPFAAPPLPSPEELALLEPYRDRLPPEVFGPLPVPPVTDGSGNMREQMRGALALLREAGWEMRDGEMRNGRGERLRLNIILNSPSMRRIFIPYAASLERLGIGLDIQLVDQTQYVSRVRAFDYDLLHATVRQSNNPGNEQRYFWGSAAADEPGSRNYAGIRDPVVDAVTERLIAAESSADLREAVHALDRLLLHGAYVIPGWYSGVLRVAWWNGRIAPSPRDPEGGLDLTAWRAAGQGAP
jgi:microcin C transport system substrate-binding protein